MGRRAPVLVTQVIADGTPVAVGDVVVDAAFVGNIGGCGVVMVLLQESGEDVREVMEDLWRSGKVSRGDALTITSRIRPSNSKMINKRFMGVCIRATYRFFLHFIHQLQYRFQFR